jgi:hypothetical protein
MGYLLSSAPHHGSTGALQMATKDVISVTVQPAGRNVTVSRPTFRAAWTYVEFLFRCSQHSLPKRRRSLHSSAKTGTITVTHSPFIDCLMA